MRNSKPLNSCVTVEKSLRLNLPSWFNEIGIGNRLGVLILIWPFKSKQVISFLVVLIREWLTGPGVSRVRNRQQSGNYHTLRFHFDLFYSYY